MKTKKTSKLTVIAFLMLLAVLGGLFPARPVAAKAKPWYKQVMKERGYKYYKRLDINRDGKKELLLSKRKGPQFNIQGDSVEIWGRVNKKTVKLGTITNCVSQMKIFYIKKYKSLVYYQYGSGTSDLKVYKINRGKLKTVKTVGTYQPYHDPKGNGYNKNYVYRINGKKVSKKKAITVWNKYYNGKTPLKFKKFK